MAEILILSARNPAADLLVDAEVTVAIAKQEFGTLEAALPLQEYLEAPSAIGTLSHPLTEIRAELPTRILEDEQTHSAPVWIVGAQPENEWRWSPHRDWHRELQSIFSPYRKLLIFVAQGRKSESNQLILCQPHEVTALHRISPSLLAKPVATLAKLAFSASGTRRKTRTLAAVLCGFICLGIWHGVPSLHQHFLTESSRQIRLYLLQKRLERPTHDWTAWQTQMTKFGTGSRANTQSALVSWHSSGEINSLIEIQRPRKRLPKGCKPGTITNHIRCTMTGRTGATEPEQTTSRSSGVIHEK